MQVTLMLVGIGAVASNKLVNALPCTCTDHTEINGSGREIGRCLSTFEGSTWCYIASRSSCPDKKKSSKNDELYWSTNACQQSPPPPPPNNKAEISCTCNDHTEINASGKEIGRCLSTFEGSTWCYISSRSSCPDKRQSSRNNELYWSTKACQQDLPPPPEISKSCGFNDSELISADVRSPVRTDSGFKWDQNKIPFYFTSSVSSKDRNVFRRAMKQIHDQSCFSFVEKKRQPTGHHLEIQTGTRTCWPQFSAYVQKRSRTKILLRSDYQLEDNRNCAGIWDGGILHELFHVLGVHHTQKRRDRDNYVRVNFNNIDDAHQYEICSNCLTPTQYDCSSIMHYGTKTAGKKNAGPTMTAKSPSCKLTDWGPDVASETDWQLLRIMCSEDTTTSEKQRLISPNYPRNYANHEDVTQKMNVPAGYFIKVTFEDFDIEDHYTCRYDYVQFKDGKGRNQGKFCGSTKPADFTIQTNTATVSFHSDYSVTRKGYKFQYEAVKTTGIRNTGIVESQKQIVAKKNLSLQIKI